MKTNQIEGKPQLIEHALHQNALQLQRELSWLSQLLEVRFKLYFQQECPYKSIYEIEPPSLADHPSIFAEVVQHYNMTIEERVCLLLALAPHVCPQILDIFFTRNEKYGRGFTEFGGVKGLQHSGFLPTGETVSFLLAANDLAKRFQLLQIFDPDHFFAKYNILRLEKDKSGEPLLSGALTISREYLSFFTTGTEYKPSFSAEFPAKRITTNLDWEDLVLEPYILEEIQEILNWLKYNNVLMNEWGLSKKIKPGFRTLFYGPPGTGKTLTACLLGKSTNLDVYRVDLSKVVSKYIGETEKNLANIFDQAQNKSWILFFDEADALFGKRTAAKDSKDRHANQEVAYLLQRIEDFPGLVILATNLKSNIDEAFARRFQSMIYFPMPRPEQRLLLWEKAFSNMEVEKEVDLFEIAKAYEVTGGAIINILRYCSLQAIGRESRSITLEDLETGIRKEFKKEGKTV